MSLAALGAAVLGPAGAPAAAAAGPGARAHHPALAVPWREAGPGWSVAEYSAASLPGAPPRQVRSKTVFYLVSPQGRRWAFYRTPAATAYPRLGLADWSGDRRRILVDGAGPSDSQRDVVEQISLATGRVITRFSLARGAIPVGYTRPDGREFLAIPGSGTGILRYSLTGTSRILARGRMLMAPLDSPRGQYVVAGARGGIDQVSNAGALLRQVRIADKRNLCEPGRWWNRTTLLASCLGRDATWRLWLVPFAGGSPRPLTPAVRAHGLFQGYVDAWRVDGALYLQADNAHDTLSIVRQSRAGSRTTIHIPGPAGISDSMLTSYRGQLLLESALGVGGPSSLFWFNPVTHAIRYLLRAPAGRYGVAAVIPFGYRDG